MVVLRGWGRALARRLFRWPLTRSEHARRTLLLVERRLRRLERGRSSLPLGQTLRLERELCFYRQQKVIWLERSAYPDERPTVLPVALPVFQDQLSGL